MYEIIFSFHHTTFIFNSDVLTIFSDNLFPSSFPYFGRDDVVKPLMFFRFVYLLVYFFLLFSGHVNIHMFLRWKISCTS
jgi:hypothetical protein